MYNLHSKIRNKVTELVWLEINKGKLFQDIIVILFLVSQKCGQEILLLFNLFKMTEMNTKRQADTNSCF